MQLYLNPYYLTLQGELYKYPGYIMLIIHFYFTCYCFFLCFYHGILRRERDYSSAFCGFMRKVRTLACASVRIRFYSFARVFPFLCFYHGILRRERDSNPRYAFGVYTLSRRAPSTTRPSLQNIRAQKYLKIQ